MNEPARSSLLDSKRFGVRVFRARVDGVEAASRLMRFVASAGVDLLIVRCPVRATAAAQMLEGAGCFLTDTLVTYRGPTKPLEPATKSPACIRPGREADRAALAAVARACFTGFNGHYHADPRLDPAAATEGYVEWACSALTDASCVVLVSESDGQLSGFLTAKKLDAKEWEILLNGVAPAFQRRGTYGALFRELGRRARAEGVGELSVSAQLSNLAPQKVWSRGGLELAHASYTFHWWAASS